MRMANIWDLNKFIKNEDEFLKIIDKQIKHPNPEEFVKLGDELFVILNNASKFILKKMNYLPPPKNFLP